ncbi:MAG: tRNA epoxyqueuosine(34) reductase QueG [Thiotrichales bacterium]|nr:tRNA epoxyqueuosine(34) reductase QueG [Thiotrichales bacterium]
MHASPDPLQALPAQIKAWGQALGFADIGISDVNLSAYESGYFSWLNQGFHGEMHYLETHGTKRTRPAELVPGTLRVISARMNYFDHSAQDALQQLHHPQGAYLSRYALGKDYHKLLRKRLEQLAQTIQAHFPELQYRAFCDSAPVLEQALAHKAGLGFIGKNSLLIHPRAGSWFFLGELYINLPIPVDAQPHKQGCGPCSACLQECPTQAILPNNQIDARRCISYLTIEYDGVIDEALRPLMGNRIYGCDDCQLVCPWNHFSSPTEEPAFQHRSPLDRAELLPLFAWDESTFLSFFTGSPIRRIGYAKWCRNLAIAIGNQALHPSTLSPKQKQLSLEALAQKLGKISEMVDVHILWAQQQLQAAPQPLHALASIPIEVTPPNPFFAKRYYLPRQKSACTSRQSRSALAVTSDQISNLESR